VFACRSQWLLQSEAILDRANSEVRLILGLGAECSKAKALDAGEDIVGGLGPTDGFGSLLVTLMQAASSSATGETRRA
jgi:hypothetical protein